MEGSGALSLLVATLFVFLFAAATLVRAVQVKRYLAGRPGTAVTNIIIVVIAGFMIVKLISVFNIAALQFASNPYHAQIRLLQQFILIAVIAWAWLRLSRLQT